MNNEFIKFQKLNKILEVLKIQVANFDKSNTSIKIRTDLGWQINDFFKELNLQDTPYKRNIYYNWNVLDRSCCEKLDLIYIIENLKKIKKDFFSNYFDEIFISHSEKDREIVKNFISLLHNIGLPKSIKDIEGNIFCSSCNGYLIPLGENNIEYIKQQLTSTDNILAIVMYSKNYMNSASCLNEAGAIWIHNIQYRPIILPDFSFEEIKGFLNPNITGFKINDKFKINEFKEFIIKSFNLPEVNYNIWEQDRDKFLTDIANLIIKN